ncbi:MAG: glycoside hydrolase family 9 protein, partial [Oscillospiraceae bacterium]|nr:glycoside hydrolase family 9 protein [Oscillospiraceae bacterium]
MNKFGIKVMALCLAAGMSISAAAYPKSYSGAADNSVVYAASSALIRNGTFDSSTGGWDVYLAGGGRGSIFAKDGKLQLQVDKLGTLNYGVQLNYDIIPLYQNGVYKLSFDISSSVDRFVEVMIQQNGGTYQAYCWKGIDLTQQDQHVELDFTMEQETDIMSKMCFNCGNQKVELDPHTITLDNVELTLVDDSQVDYSTIKQEVEQDILTNQIGYLPNEKKTAVFRGSNPGTKFTVVNADTNEEVLTGDITDQKSNSLADETDWTGDFSQLKKEGTYYIKTDSGKQSLSFMIGNDVYNDLLEDSVRMLYLQRCGCDINDADAGHKACHTTMATVYGTNDKIDVTGGWHDAGDYGRYIVPAAKTVADLMLAYQKNPKIFTDDTNIPESGNGVPDILDEARFELEWMFKMQNKSNGGVYHKVSCANFPGMVMPEKETDELIVTPVSTTATADFAASMAMAYEWYKNIDQQFAEKCLNAAESAWSYLEQNPNLSIISPEEIVTGEYGDTTDKDERYWAAAQLYRATGDDKYKQAFNNLVNTKVYTGMDWSTVGDYGSIAYLTMDESKIESTVYDRIKTGLLKETSALYSTSEASAYGTAISKFNWGSNMTIANSGALMYVADELDDTKDYAGAANEQLNYLLGKNACGRSFVTGYGSVYPEHPHHRPSMNLSHAVIGMLVGGVNSALEDSAAKAYCFDSPAAKCYVDNDQSYSTNEITIYWNSPLVYLLANTMSDDSTTEPPVSETTTTTEPTTTTTTT